MYPRSHAQPFQRQVSSPFPNIINRAERQPCGAIYVSRAALLTLETNRNVIGVVKAYVSFVSIMMT
jgi:hypothetical protein